MSHSFTDTNGKAWLVDINVNVAKRIKKQLQLDLLDKLGLQLLEGIASDPIQLANVLYVCLEDQATAAGINDEQFGSALSGDVLENAATAFMEAVRDFFPSARRQVIAKALGKMKAVEAATTKRALELLDSPELDQAIANQMKQGEAKFREACGDSSITSPAP